MTNVIKEVIDFNRKAGLLATPCPKKEASYQIEEALEDFDLVHLSNKLHASDEPLEAKELSRKIMDIVTLGAIPDIPKVKQIDKAADAIIFALGHLAKLGLTEGNIMEVLDIVITANKAKLGCPRDEAGKLTKPADFEENYAPEPKLRALLERVKNE